MGKHTPGEWKRDRTLVYCLVPTAHRGGEENWISISVQPGPQRTGATIADAINIAEQIVSALNGSSANAQMLEALTAIIAAEDEFARHAEADRGIVIDDKITDALELGRAALATAEPEETNDR